MIITANDLKTKGVSAFESKPSNDDEVIVTVRGQQKYVIINMERYDFLRECELEAALNETKKDIKNGNFTHESIKKHISRIKNEL